MPKPTNLLTDTDRQHRLGAFSRKLRLLLKPKRWTDPESFQQAFRSERWSLESDLRELCEEFSFTPRDPPIISDQVWEGAGPRGLYYPS